MRPLFLHDRIMPVSPPRRLRRNTLVPMDQHVLSEGELVTENGRTILHVFGGPPFATLELLAARERVGSITLNHLGAGSVVMAEPATIVSGSVPIAVRHGSCTLLKGDVGSPGAVDLTTGDRR